MSGQGLRSVTWGWECLGKGYGALHGGGSVWVRVTERYIGVGVSGQGLRSVTRGWECLSKGYGALHGVGSV